MSAFANLTLQNNAASNVVFGPAAIDSAGVAKWMTSDSVYDAKSLVTMSVTQPKPGGSVVRIKQKVSIPVMDTVDTNLQVGLCSATIEVVIPKRASSTQRLDLRAYAKNLLADAVSTAAFTSFESIY